MTTSHENPTDGEHSLAESFADPLPEYGPVPYWWWDGKELDPEQMTAQLEALEERGVTGVCFISKFPTGFAGDEFEYFSEAWWSIVRHVVEECDRLDMQLWVHDETYHLGPENNNGNQYWQDKLRTGTTAAPDLQGQVLDRVAADVTDGESVALDVPADLDPLVIAAYPRDGEGRLCVDDAVALEDVGEADGHRIEWTPPDDGTWHVTAIGRRPEGLCYTDPAAAERYIDLHFEEYVRRLGDHVGDTLVGTNEDELHVLDGAVPADEAVFERVREEEGYDPTPHLVGLYEDVTDTPSIRLDYYDAVTALLEESWFEPLKDWHEEHDLLRSHDNWGRNDLADGTEQYGDYYRMMRWYRAPGYDDGWDSPLGDRNFFDAKLSASIAACYDRDRVWGELFHSTGWDFEPADQLAGIVENVCYGCSLYNNHSCFFTTNGGWWQHTAGDPHFRQPYWDDVDAINEAATRLSAVFSAGDPVVDAAVLHPIASLQADWHPEDGIGETGRAIDAATRDLAESLYKSGTDLVIADPESLAESAVETGGVDVAGTDTPALVLPPTTAIRASTLETIRECYAAGGVVVAIGRLPSTLHGGDDATLRSTLADVFGTTTVDVDDHCIERNEAGGAAVLASDDADVAAVIATLIDPDVDAPADIYHAHRRIGDRDAYLLYNARDEERSIDVRLRAEGRPERWDPRTGAIDTVYDYDRDNGCRLSFDLEPYGFELVVLRPEAGEARVAGTSLDTVTDVEPTDGGLRIHGTAAEADAQTVRVARDGTIVAGESVPDRDPTTIALDDWTFEPEPTLENAWGDFRYPASEATIGPEVRWLHHRQESPQEDGVAAGWFDPGTGWTDEVPPYGPYTKSRMGRAPGSRDTGVASGWAVTDDDGGWPTVEPTYGPYFLRWTGGPDDSPAARPSVNGPAPGWEPYTVSKETGRPGTHPFPRRRGYSSTLSDEFLVAPADERAHFWTTVRAPADGMAGLQFGPGIERIELGGLEIDDLSLDRGRGLSQTIEEPPQQRRIVHLSEGPTPLHIAVEPGAETHVALEPIEEDARDRDLTHVPRIRWFMGDDPYVLDSRPWDDDPVGWYRFHLPAGTVAFDCPVRGPARVWVDGDERSVDDGRVALQAPLSEPTPVAIRIGQERGRYGGAAWEGPVAVETERIAAPLTSWEELGYRHYSGRARYRTTVEVPAIEPEDRVTLDLGAVHATAAVTVNGTTIGSVCSRPFELDVSEAVEPGANTIEIRVANTLANHFQGETPHSWADTNTNPYRDNDTDGGLPNMSRDTTLSGLLGPVELRIEPTVSIEAS